MKPQVFFIHTIHGLTDLFDRLAGELLGPCEVSHLADQSLIQRLLRDGALTPEVYARVCAHVVGAAETGADYIQLTCSSISPCAEVARKLVRAVVLTIDEPMVRAAVKRHERIGVIATNPATLKPSMELVSTVSRDLGRPVQIVSRLCAGAYDALFRGDRPEHDRIVLEQLEQLLGTVDAVCLAQVSMARLAEQLPAAKRVKPIYSSPRPAIEHLAHLLQQDSATLRKPR